MTRKSFLLGLTLLLTWGLAGAWGLAAETLKFGTAVKDHPPYYLPVLAAEEKGFWKAQGLEVEWVPFKSGTELVQAVAGKEINIGFVPPIVAAFALAARVPIVFVSNLTSPPEFILWVRSESPFKEPKELKGARIGIMRPGTLPHVYARAITKAAGVEKEMKFIATGGTTENVAALRAKVVEAIVMPVYFLISLKVTGEVRELADAAEYLPKEWLEHGLFARKEFITEKPDTVRKVVKAILQGANFAMDNRSWSMGKLKEVSGYSDEVASLIFKQLTLSRTGKIDRKAMENVMNFLFEYGVVPKEKVPPVDELFTMRFIE